MRWRPRTASLRQPRHSGAVSKSHTLDRLAWKATQGRVNNALMQVERDFLLQGRLPERPWFRHAFNAPGVYTGYTAVPLPGLGESVETGDWWLAAEQGVVVREVLERATARIFKLFWDF